MGAAPSLGLVRRPSQEYAPSYHSRGVTIDPLRANRQHDIYVATLQSAGIAVRTIDGDPAYYDCVFVEDTAIVWGFAALIVNMGGRQRDGEQHAVRTALGKSHRLSDVPRGGCIDGGDVLHCDGTTFVGQSSRTNAIGIESLRHFLTPFGRTVVPVPVERALHLKTAVTYLGDGVLIAARELIDLAAMSAFDVIETAAGEAGAANCLRIGNHLLMPAGYPATARRVAGFAARRNLHLHEVDISEFEKGGGGLTCLSLLWSAD